MFGHYLWATSRKGWVKKNPKGCIFCGIARDDPKIPKKVLYKDKKLMVIMNIFPYNVGHLQVVPVKHIETLEELKEEEMIDLFRMVRKATVLLNKTLRPEGFNIGINMGGEVAGGSIGHLHVQIVPRYKRDLGFMEITADTKVMPESLEDTHKKLMKKAGLLK